MDTNDVVDALSALAQPTRLGVFRLLMKAGLNGLPAGAIADAVGVPGNTMSTHLAILARAGLVTPRRQGRSIIYTASLAETRDLLSFLVDNCCGGHPEICAPLIEIADRTCCGPAKPEKSGKKNVKKKGKKKR